MSLYTRYRPKDWDSVVGQPYITTILRNSLKKNALHHAYLFHGSRGTGKTSSARILAEGINCLDLRDGNPCHQCINCEAFDNGAFLDVIEIDAASHTGVDNIRDLIEKARYEPNQGKYKIYIIDEVHMLSTGAFNALLKTLEEPPAHVKFILATTEIEKVPETIRSRALRFDFRKISLDDIENRLRFVCETEKIQADDEALSLIATSARGGLRDALTLLEQNTIDHEVTTTHVRYTLSLLEEHLIDTIITSLREKNTEKILALVAELSEKHLQARSLLEQLMYRLRDLMIEQVNDPEFHEYHKLYESLERAYTKVRLVPDEQMFIEITLVAITKEGSIPQNTGTTPEKPVPQVPQTTPVPATKTLSKIRQEEEPRNKPETIPTVPNTPKIPEKAPKVPEEPIKVPEEKPETSTSDTGMPFSFPKLLQQVKEQSMILASDIKETRFQLDGNTLKLIFSKKWNYDRVNTAKAKSEIASACQEIFGSNWNIVTELSEQKSSLANQLDDVF